MLNISAEEFILRTENQFLLQKIGIEPNLLIFKNHLNLHEMQNHASFKISLVDHHVLRPEEQFLAPFLVEIFDHRPVDQSAVWDANKVNVHIELVASCSTLIAEQILQKNNNISNALLANLLYYVIVFDTVAFNVQAQRATELDIAVANKFIQKFHLNEDSKAIFNELWAAHMNVSHLSPKQLLSRDLKIVEGIPVAGLAMLNEEFPKLPHANEHMIAFCEQKSYSNMVIIGLTVVDQEVSRDIAVFNHCTNDAGLGAAITDSLENALVLKGYDFHLEAVGVNVPNVMCFKQNNITLTRKHILPIIKQL